MTAICPGNGPSGPSAGYSGVISVTSAALGALAKEFPIVWAAAYAAGLAAVEWDLNQMCTVDPPADPGFTAADADAILKAYLNPVAFAAASGKLVQLIQRFAWLRFCVCNGQPPSTLPAVPAPAGLPNVSPTVKPATVGTCDTIGNGGQVWHSNNGALSTTHPGVAQGMTLLRVTTAAAVVNLPNTTARWHIEWVSGFFPNYVEMGSPTATVTMTPPANLVTDIPWRTGATFARIVFDMGPEGGDTRFTWTMDVYCNGAGPQTQLTPCCPPDPSILAKMDTLLTAVTLLQRQLAPFAYISGTVHAGLTGAGSFAIQGLLGVRVASTSRDPSFGHLGTSPTEYFDLGYITFGTADGYPQAFRFERDPQVIMPARSSVFTTLAYDLPPGVTVSVTELLQEP